MFKCYDDSTDTEHSRIKDIYKNKPNRYLYRCIVRGIVGLCGCEKKIMPNEELPSFEALTAEYPPWLIKRVFKKLKRKGYVVERNNKLIVVDTQIVKEIKNSDERWYYILSILFGVSFLGFLITLTCLLI